MFMTNAKSTGHAEHYYQGYFSSFGCEWIKTVDQAMGVCLTKSSSSPEALTVEQLEAFLTQETPRMWPRIATSHFAQASFMY